eukprot:3489323-Rhodomonas_salina.1
MGGARQAGRVEVAGRGGLVRRLRSVCGDLRRSLSGGGAAGRDGRASGGAPAAQPQDRLPSLLPLRPARAHKGGRQAPLAAARPDRRYRKIV